MSPDSPQPRDILDQHMRVGEGLRALASRHLLCAADPMSAFFGMTLDEFDAALRQTAEEQDKQAVLMLAASCEAVLRRDFRARVAVPRNRRNPPDAEFIALFRAHAERVRLDQVLDVWRSTTGASLHDLPRLLKRRHWLAHGRYWADKSGYTADPRLVFNLIHSVFQAFQAHANDFPRAS